MTEGEAHTITREELTALSKTERQRYIKLAFALVRDIETAKDIYQDSLLYILMNKENLKISNPRTYFAGIIRYKCLNYLRNTNRQEGIRNKMQDAAKLRANEKILSAYHECGINAKIDIDDMLKLCREQLPALTFDIFTANRFKGLSYTKIAQKYGISERKVVAEIQKALKIFRIIFKDYNLFSKNK